MEVVRTYKCNLVLSKYKKSVVDNLTYNCKNVYNISLYFTRQWYVLYELCLKFFTDNFVLYEKDFTIHDKYLIVRQILKDKDEDEIACDNIIHKILKSLKTNDFKKFAKLKHHSKSFGELIIDYQYMDAKDGKSPDSHFDMKTFCDQLSKNLNESLIHSKNPINFEIFKQDLIRVYTNNNNEQTDQKQEPTEQDPKNKLKNLIPPSYVGSYTFYKYVMDKIVTSNIRMSYNVAQQVMRKVDSAYASFFGLLKIRQPNQKINIPKYLDKKAKYNAIFPKNAFYIIQNKDKYILALSLGLNYEMPEGTVVYPDPDNKKKYITKPYLKKCTIQPKNSKGYYVINQDGKQYYLHKKDKNIHRSKSLYISLGKFLGKIKNITEVEIVPLYQGTLYNLLIKYKTVTAKQITKPNIATDIAKYKKLEAKNTDIQIDKDLYVENLTDTDILMIDPGMKNLVTMCHYKNIINPIIIDGSRLTKINRMYANKIKKYQSYIKKSKKINTDAKLQKLNNRRINVVTDILHQISSAIMHHCVVHNIKTIAIGYNKGWKTGVNMGAQNNRDFYAIPYRKFLDMLFYKGDTNMIKVVEVQESYTSICDFLNREKICRHDVYSGKRDPRGKFMSATGTYINADVNGSLNIGKKYIQMLRGDILADGFVSNVLQNIEKIKRPKKIKIKDLANLKSAINKEYLDFTKTPKLYLKELKKYNLNSNPLDGCS